jgi:hypothetical protein
LTESPNGRIERREAGDISKTDLIALPVIVATCGILSYLRWTKMDTLVWGDTARWLFEAQRVAAGQLPYKDFSWIYPPFSVLSLGWMMRWFGVNFSVAQLYVDIVSMSLVLAAYFLVRNLFPRFLVLPLMLCFVAVCGTSLNFFNIFSLLTYVPALQTAVCGFLIFLLGILQYARTGKITALMWLMVTLGAFVSAYSKPETLLATYGTLLLLAIVDRNYWFDRRERREWLRHYAMLGLACVAPVLAAYLWTGAATGFANMMAGLGGYGLASRTCPWWPTGLGVFGAVASLGEATFLLAVLSLTRQKYFGDRFGRRYSYGLAGGLAGGAMFASYVFYNNWELLTGSRPVAEKIWYSGQSTFWTSAVLLPVMWTCAVLWLYLVLRAFFLRGQRISADHLLLLVLLTGPVVMSARGWFNWLLDSRTQVPGICYPFFLVLGPYLLWRALVPEGTDAEVPSGIRSAAGCAIVGLLMVYSTLRVVSAYPQLLSDKPYEAMSTLAGEVRLKNYQTDAEIYQFVLENTSATDTVLDLPYGGGINFAAHRLSPIFQIQFQQLSVPDRLLESDLETIRQHPPKVVIADNAPNYGAIHGWNANGCVFPRLVWKPATDEQSDRVAPAITYIEENYRVAKVVGRKLLLVPR